MIVFSLPFYAYFFSFRFDSPNVYTNYLKFVVVFVPIVVGWEQNAPSSRRQRPLWSYRSPTCRLRSISPYAGINGHLENHVSFSVLFLHLKSIPTIPFKTRNPNFALPNFISSLLFLFHFFFGSCYGFFLFVISLDDFIRTLLARRPTRLWPLQRPHRSPTSN